MSNKKQSALNEQKLRELNPWVEILKNKSTVLKGDTDFISKLNERAAVKFKIQNDLPPEPYHGRPFTADVFLLALNPGYVEKEQGYLTKNPGLKKTLLDNLLFQVNDYPLVFLNPKFKESPGRVWWDKKLKPLYALGYTSEQLSSKICHLQYFPYHSASYKGSKTTLASQAFTFELLRYAIQKKKMIILLRSEKLWTTAVPELTPDKYHKLNSYQNVVLSEQNMGMDVFKKFLRTLGAPGK